MDPVVAYNEAVNALVAFLNAPRSLLHVHAGMIIYLGCLLALGSRRGSLAAMGVTLLLALAHEMMNRVFHGHWRWADTTQDLVLTLFWPTVYYAVTCLRRRHWAARTRLGAEGRPTMVAATRRVAGRNPHALTHAG